MGNTQQQGQYYKNEIKYPKNHNQQYDQKMTEFLKETNNYNSQGSYSKRSFSEADFVQFDQGATPYSKIYGTVDSEKENQLSLSIFTF